jgi:hypothetical protein
VSRWARSRKSWSLAPGRFNRAQDRPHGIDHRIQRPGHAVVEPQLAVAEPPEEVLAGVREGPELREPEEPAVALDGVDGAEDARQPLLVAGRLLQGDQVAVELVEIFRRFDQEFLDELLVRIRSDHGCASFPQAYSTESARAARPETAASREKSAR